MFTGDSSGDFLYRTLFKFGFCTQEVSSHRNDGLKLRNTYITAALHCVPPANRPTAQEIRSCRPFLMQELSILGQIRIVVALGHIAWEAFLASRRELGLSVPKPKPRFGHLAEVHLDSRTLLIGSYHPSRQNTQTGRLTRELFDAVFARAREALSAGGDL
jgi:uracil-DNA glycosylase family 4